MGTQGFPENIPTDTARLKKRKKTPHPAGKLEFLQFRIVSESGDEIVFQTKYTKKMEEVMKKYYKHLGIPEGSIRFVYDGTRVKSDDTPESLDLENDDIINAMVEQTGGGEKKFRIQVIRLCLTRDYDSQIDSLLDIANREMCNILCITTVTQTIPASPPPGISGHMKTVTLEDSDGTRELDFRFSQFQSSSPSPDAYAILVDETSRVPYDTCMELDAKPLFVFDVTEKGNALFIFPFMCAMHKKGIQWADIHQLRPGKSSLEKCADICEAEQRNTHSEQQEPRDEDTRTLQEQIQELREEVDQLKAKEKDAKLQKAVDDFQQNVEDYKEAKKRACYEDSHRRLDIEAARLRARGEVLRQIGCEVNIPWFL